MRRVLGLIIAAWQLGSGEASAQKPPLLPEKDVAALVNELSGEAAKRNLEGIARFHRQRGSQGFHAAAELVAERLRAYGLSDVEILQFPADGKIFYGTQRSRPAWDAEHGELWEMTQEGLGNAAKVGKTKIASYEAEPLVLAEDSESADVFASVVDVGEGTKESDYAGKEVQGKIVLVSAQPGAVQDLAVGKFGAAGIVSYAQNQRTAWWGEDENLVRWGHLETFSPNKTFAFMVSLGTARKWKERLARGEAIPVHAVVKAGQHPGNYEVVTATIPGADPQAQEEEVAFSCHLDHQRPGANDNASGCVTILEVARTLEKLIQQGALARPERTIRFLWPPEIEGTITLLNAKPELARRIKAVVHMDMVGGGPETKAVFHVTRGPMSLPSFVQDVAWAFAEWVNQESYQFAATGKANYPMVSPEGGREPLRAEYSPYTMGSDHDVYQDSSFGIPAIYLNDWPDRYIHTNFDSAAHIDPTKLKRAAFIGAASGYWLASRLRQQAEDLSQVALRGELLRRAQQLTRDPSLTELERKDAETGSCYYQREIEKQLNALKKEKAEPVKQEKTCFAQPPGLDTRDPVKNQKWPSYQRNRKTRGPLAVFGYDYFQDHWVKSRGGNKPRLLEYEGRWGSGEEYAYEVLNLVETLHSPLWIKEIVSTEYGPVPLELVVEYLQALEKVGIVEQTK